jgi:hypothetical protein
LAVGDITERRISKIFTDVDKATTQYGRWEDHDNEEARSRYIASVSSLSC